MITHGIVSLLLSSDAAVLVNHPDRWSRWLSPADEQTAVLCGGAITCASGCGSITFELTGSPSMLPGSSTFSV